MIKTSTRTLKIKSFSPLPRQFSSLSWRFFTVLNLRKGNFCPDSVPSFID
nr:MAG TPA: hypothetical protein [Caudoviricetes sp.]